MDNYYITSNLTQEKTAWSKAVADVEYFLNQAGFKPVSVQRCIYSTENYLPEVLSPEKSGILLIQFPRILFEGFNLPWFLDYMKANYSKFKLTALVHDLDSIRFGSFFKDGTLPEVPLLNGFDQLITVNDAMLNVLKEHGAKPSMVPLQIFDYALNEEKRGTEEGSNLKTVAFAGNLRYNKSQFIYDLNKIDLKDIVINLYGPYLDLKKFNPTESICYKGEFSSKALPKAVNDSFGLCWDGTCIDGCCGNNCQYFKYSNPHKVSFYLAMGIPVIVSKDISTASLIEKERVGLAINSLYELPETLNRLSEEEYRSMKKNCLRMSERLRSGYYLTNVIRNIEETFQYDD